jgi:hypothetical protein
MAGRRFGKWVTLAIIPASVLFAARVASQQPHTLSVTGRPREIAVTEVGGHFYVEVEALRQLLDGSLTLNGMQFVLSLPSSGANRPATAHSENEPPASGFSKQFLNAGIEQMSAIREWRSTLVSAVQRGYPITEEWMTGFSGRAQTNLRLVSVAVSTDSDRNALQLLTNEFNNMKRLSDRFVDANKSRTYMPPDSLQNDALDRRILNCGHSLAAMAASGQFVDDGSCH